MHVHSDLWCFVYVPKSGEMPTSALLGPPIESDDEDAAQEFEPDDDDENDDEIDDDEDEDEGKINSALRE